jgi:hypothetical protein
MGFDNRRQFRDHQDYAAEGVAQARRYIAAVVAKNNGTTEADYARLKGLVALIYGYLNCAANMGNDFANPKYLAPLMQRTNLGALFKLLSAREQAAFAEDKFALLLQHAGRRAGDSVFPGKFLITVATQGLKIGKWFESIVKGEDLLIKGGESMSRWTDKFAIEKMHLNSATDIGRYSVGTNQPRTRDKAGGVFEFRRLTAGVPYTAWRATGLALFDMIRAVNSGELSRPDAPTAQQPAPVLSAVQQPLPVSNAAPLPVSLQAPLPTSLTTNPVTREGNT